MPRNNHPSRHRESGNIFFLVMVGVVLFGALMYTFSRSARQGDGNLSAQRIAVSASDVLSYAQRLERGVSRVSLRGCMPAMISFEHEGNPVYPANADAPSDFSCHVFRPMGGSVSPLPATSFNISGLQIYLSGGTDFRGIGTTGPTADGHQDLVAWFTGLPADLCRELNRRLEISGIPTITSVQSWNFGALNGGQKWGSTQIDVPALLERSAACVHQPNAQGDAFSLPTGYHFFQILLPR